MHTLGAGTDAAIPAVRYIVLAPVVPAVVLFAVARFGNRKPKPARPTAERARVPGSPPRLSAGEAASQPLS